ncbi:MAG: PAS domain-containing sensor histidine kinase [Candidatus Helarchaeota archaeon]|nr:PAS domain-containing sensor histidine kinase [Candidatus Helarchaeota archaeon]
MAHDSEDINQKINQILEEQKSYLGERQYRTKDGRLVDVEVRASLIHYQDKHVLSIISRDITERKIAESQLRDSEAKYRLISENANDLIGIVNQRYEIEFINDETLQRMSGYSKEELIGTNALEFVHPDDHRKVLNALVMGFEKGEGRVEARVLHKDGHVIWLELRGRTFRDVDGELKGIVISRDITERKQAELELRESEEKYRLICENANDLISVISDKFEFEYINERMIREIMGYTKEEVIGQLSLNFAHPDDVEQELEYLRQGSLTGGGQVEARLRRKDGKYVWFDIKGRTFRDKEGNLKGLMIARDMTERRESELKLKESEEKYRLISENANDLIEIMNQNFEYEFVNEDAHKRIMGHGKEDLIGKSALDFLHPDDLGKTMKTFEDGVNIGEGSAELRYRHKDGHYLWLELRGKTFIDKFGETKGIIISRNITERKKTAEELKRSEKKYRDLLQNLSDVVVEMSVDGTFMYVSPQIRTMLGYNEYEIIGKSGLDFIHPDDVPHVIEKLREALKTQQRLYVEYRVKQKNGHYVHVALNGGLVKEAGKLKYVGVVRDITQRKDLEKLQDEFYQEISQELNTPLMTIKNITEILMKSSNLDDLQVKNLRKILKNEDRIEQLINEMFSYSRLKLGLTQLQKDYFYASDIIKEIREEFHDLIATKNLSIETNFEPDDKLPFDKSQISKVIRNLFDNAVKYSFPNGIIFIKSVIKDNTWTFSIRDRGIGISQEEYSKLFMRYPEFVETDKLSVTGIGIGLAICKKILEAYGGRIWGTSDGINKGATFSFEINLNAI